jgi:hypothetical protein
VLRDTDPEEDTRAAPNKKRRREDGGDAGGIAVPARKTFKQGPFARPAAAARERPEPAALPLSRKELKQVAEGRKATRKPNHTLIQARACVRACRPASSRQCANCRCVLSPALTDCVSPDSARVRS